MSALVVPVVVLGWQYECCGVPPAVGDRVSWHLELLDDTWPEATTDLPVVVEEAPAAVLTAWLELGNAVGPAPVVLRHAGLVAYVPDRTSIASGAAHGVLVEDHHTGVPNGLPRTSGVIRRVRLVSREYVQQPAEGSVDGGGFEGVVGTEELVEVTAAPPFLPWELPPRGALRHRLTAEVLVDLLVDPVWTPPVWHL